MTEQFPLTRRGFLRLGALAVPAAALLAACGSAASGLTGSSQPAGSIGSPSGVSGSGSMAGAAGSGGSSSGASGGAGSAGSQSGSAAAAGTGASSAGASGNSGSTAAGTSNAASSAGTAAACSLTPEQEEGPFYVAGQMLRQDVTNGKAGVPLRLRLTVQASTSCKPLANASVDIWHADATGNYSSGSGDQLFLRGTQLTDASGAVEFNTIYPGWYQGRAVHIHMKVHIGGTAATVYNGGHVAHTGQMFFAEDVSNQVYKLAPYSSHTGRRTLQSQDGVFDNENGSSCIASLTPLKPGSVADGYMAAVTLGVNPNATPAPVGAGVGGGVPGGPGGPPRGPRS